MFRIIASLVVAFSASSVLAQDTGNGVAFHLGVGPKTAPEYFGSSEQELGFTGSFSLERLRWGSIQRGGETQNGFGFAPSFNFIGARGADDYDALAGLDDVDLSIEVGGKARYLAENYEVFAALRYGVIGHEAIVGELGADLILRPTDALTLTAGPRLLWGSDDYMATYFGVTAAESAASSFAAFDAEAGLASAGVELKASYAFDEDWGLVGTVTYDDLQEDAAGSPISTDDAQLGASLVVTRRFTIAF